jgi:hypothetical protein
MGEMMVKRARGAMLQIIFQGLHMIHVIFILVYKLKILYFEYPI